MKGRRAGRKDAFHERQTDGFHQWSKAGKGEAFTILYMTICIMAISWFPLENEINNLLCNCSIVLTLMTVSKMMLKLLSNGNHCIESVFPNDDRDVKRWQSVLWDIESHQVQTPAPSNTILVLKKKNLIFVWYTVLYPNFDCQWCIMMTVSVPKWWQLLTLCIPKLTIDDESL